MTCNKCGKEFILNEEIIELVKSKVISIEYKKTIPDEGLYKICIDCFNEDALFLDMLFNCIYYKD